MAVCWVRQCCEWVSTFRKECVFCREECCRSKSEKSDICLSLRLQAALYVVLPLGGFAVLSNFAKLRRPALFLMGATGLFLVFSAHACVHHEEHHRAEQRPSFAAAESPAASSTEGGLGSAAETLHHQREAARNMHCPWLPPSVAGLLREHHALFSILGASLLLLSNFLSHRAKHLQLGPHCCGGVSSAKQKKGRESRDLERSHGDRKALLKGSTSSSSSDARNFAKSSSDESD